MALNLNTRAVQQNPYDLYRQLRAEQPVAPVGGSLFSSAPSWLVTRYADVLMVLKDPRFSVDVRKAGGRDMSHAWWIPSLLRAFLNSMVMVDNPDHTRLRNLVHKAFTPKMIQQLSGRITTISADLLDKMAAKPNPDLIHDFALPLPLTVICDMMGVPEPDRQTFHSMISRFLDATSPASMLAQFPNAFRMQRFFKKLIALRRREPRDDLISALAVAEEQGDKLSEDELIAMLLLLLLAGHETTVNLIGNGTLAFMENPDQWARLKAEPALLDSAIEEILRYTNPVQQIAPRYAVADVDLGGHHIGKGHVVLVGIASANRDETAFPNAAVFDIARKPNQHIAFGFGLHYCLGAPLARLEGRLAFEALIERFPNMQLAAPVSSLKWRGGPSLHGLRHLPLRLNA